jgi:type IV pilus assembly protein PilA
MKPTTQTPDGPRAGALDGFTLIELLVVVTVIGTIAAIAIPGILRARLNGNETSAIASLRAVTSAQTTYASSCGGNGFTNDLADLAIPPAAGGPSFISPDLSVNGTQKSGYTFTVGAGANVKPVLVAAATCNGTPSFSSYHATGTRVSTGTGTRAFATNANRTIFQNFTGVAIPINMAGATPID